MVEGPEFVEQMCDIVLGQLNALELVGVAGEIVGTTPLEVQQGRNGLVGSHEGRIPSMGMGVRSALGHGGIEVIVFVDDVALGSGVSDVSSQAINLLLHF